MMSKSKKIILLIIVVAVLIIAAITIPRSQDQESLSQQDAQQLTTEFVEQNFPDYLPSEDPEIDIEPIYTSFKPFDIIPHTTSSRVAITYGPNTWKEPVGIFVVQNDNIVDGFAIEGAWEHMVVDNIEWKTANQISYDLVTVDIGGRVAERNFFDF
ncbi:MAG: hypothetical protein WDZ80_01500 [Candidatus Paceibacterota bacterium]